MEDTLISVVLPIYNVEKYLRRCVDSVRQQTYQNIEIILVDDGSTDGCAALCDSFAEEDSRIRVIHQKNGGLSNARNTGTSFAKGEYITFIDSDDYVSKTYVSYLYSLIERFHTPMSLCMHRVISEDGTLIKDYQIQQEPQCLSDEVCLKCMLYHNQIDTSAWGKMYRRDLALEIQYPDGKIFEDIGTTYRFFLKSGIIGCGYESHYNYVVRQSSIVTGDFHLRKLDLIEMTDFMAKEVLQQYPQLEAAVLRRRVYARFSTLNQIPSDSDYREQRKEIISFIANYRYQILADPLAPKRDKLAIICMTFGESLYRFVWKLVQNSTRKKRK